MIVDYYLLTDHGAIFSGRKGAANAEHWPGRQDQ
jgi:hypothetical protein